MRWLFLIMLVLNLSYIAWEMLNVPNNDTLVNVPPLPEVPTILLADESDAGGVEDKTATESVVDNDAQVAQAARLIQLAQEGKTDMENTVEDVSAEKKVDALAVEQAAVSVVAEKNKVVVQQELIVKAEVPDACFTLGPFRELDRLRGLTRNIKEYVAEASFRSRVEKEPTLFWVYLPSLDNRAKAEQVGLQLKAKNIKDFYIIRSGEKQNGISLGQFRNKSGAYRLAKKVTKLGFSVEVEPLFKTYTLYWLDYRLVNGRLIPDEITAEYLTDKISRLSRSCESLSSEVL